MSTAAVAQTTPPPIGIEAEHDESAPFVDDGTIQDPMPPEEELGDQSSSASKKERRIKRTSESSADDPKRKLKSQPEDVPSRQRATVFSFNPAALIFGIIAVEIERATTEQNSIFFAPEVLFGSTETALGTLTMSGFGASIGGRVFAVGEAPKGFWIGAHAGLALVSLSLGSTTISAAALRAGADLGYSFVFDSGFYLSLGGGGAYTTAGAAGGGVYASGSGFGPTLRLAIGIAP